MISGEPSRIRGLRGRIERLSRPISAITAYDYPMARLADGAAIDLILVGDSLGMVIAGMEDTTSVTMEQMVYHTTLVRRGVHRAILVSDLPIHSYETPEAAILNANRLLESGAEAVKLEGGRGQSAKIRELTRRDIPVIGHLGMLPQRVREEGGYRKKGRTEEDAERLLADAREIEDAGVLMIVMESIEPETARRISASIAIPTLGIGSGKHCAGQIRVLHDVIGAYPWFVPPFARAYADVAGQVSQALLRYREELE